MEAVDQLLEQLKVQRQREDEERRRADEERRRNRAEDSARFTRIEERQRELERNVTKLDARIDSLRQEQQERLAGMLESFWSVTKPYLSSTLNKWEMADVYSTLLQTSKESMLRVSC